MSSSPYSPHGALLDRGWPAGGLWLTSRHTSACLSSRPVTNLGRYARAGHDRFEESSVHAQRVAPVDASYLSMDAANTTGNVCLMLTLEGQVTRDDLADHVARALPSLPMLRRRLHEVAWGLDLPWWVDDATFDLDRHVIEHVVPAPVSYTHLTLPTSDLV